MRGEVCVLEGIICRFRFANFFYRELLHIFALGRYNFMVMYYVTYRSYKFNYIGTLLII